MLLTISTTHEPATDLGFLLHKNPGRVYSTDLPFGRAHVVYSDATEERCTAALLVEVDPVGLVRGRKGQKGNDFSLDHYVNDRPYAASSFLSVALNKCFGTALGGRSKERPDLVDAAIPLAARLPVVPCRGGETLLRRLFEPLGYHVTASPIPLDPQFPGWGNSRYLDVELTACCRLRDLLEHLFVLLPVLDDDKHYWVGPDEIDKLFRRGGGWLAAHSERELIAHRYLRHDRRLTRDALARLMEEDVQDDPDEVEAGHDAEEATVPPGSRSDGAARGRVRVGPGRRLGKCWVSGADPVILTVHYVARWGSGRATGRLASRQTYDRRGVGQPSTVVRVSSTLRARVHAATATDDPSSLGLGTSRWLEAHTVDGSRTTPRGRADGLLDAVAPVAPPHQPKPAVAFRDGHTIHEGGAAIPRGAPDFEPSRTALRTLRITPDRGSDRARLAATLINGLRSTTRLTPRRWPRR
jgi:hypothetical protein